MHLQPNRTPLRNFILHYCMRASDAEKKMILFDFHILLARCSQNTYIFMHYSKRSCVRKSSPANNDKRCIVMSCVCPECIST